MRSHLTRNVYLRLLASHGLLRPCPSTLPGRCVAVSSRPSPSPLLARRQPRRTFFGIFQKPPRMLKEPDIEPGYDVLLHYRSLETENARPPAREDLLKGWRQFIQYKRKSYSRSLNPTQAFLTLRLLHHLVATSPENEGQGEDLSFTDLRAALYVTATKPPKGTTEHHLELATLLYGEIERRIQSMRELGIDEEVIKEAVGGKDTGDFELFLTALTQYGGALEAAEHLAEFRARLAAKGDTKSFARVRVLWTLVLRGLAKEGREAELLAEWGRAEKANFEYMPPVHEIMTTFYATRDRIEETKQWFEKPVHGGWQRSPKAYMEVVRFALRNGEQEWLQPIFEELINSNPPKEWWNVVFQWAVLVMDKGVEDIKQMMQIMSAQTGGKETKEGTESVKPDASTIDALIRAAIEKQNPYLAERGVQVIYDKLLKGEVIINQDQDLPVLNKYLRALCAVPEPDIGRILDITADLEQRHATLEPDTVVSLCMVFLRNDNQYDVIDTLSLHTVSYSLEERAQVRRAFVEYCLDRRVSTARVWDCYSLLRQFFPETEPDERVRLMDAFFARNRPDMACYIFGHMRSQGNLAQRPTADMYVRCLEGLGRHPEPGPGGDGEGESLRMVHNMLKMDTTVQMDTRLYNALMIAYAACGEPDVAVEFWRDITESAEGPSYASLAIVFWACELLPFGDRTARGIWQKIQRMDLEVPPDVFWAYCGAIAGSGHLEEVIRLIRGMDASVGYGPGMMTLGVTYNALPGSDRKEEFEAWAAAEYPEIWAQLEKKGRTETLRGTKFNIVRDMKA
ncbi:hypothetical protein B0I37DRAFT_416662 [Chaetomium sp. MPI-CAGE-AT-0009]|nr:hypothetical protein B0I37DRAFT_416662 [Chaetomium sp. MPI-CAGE-AT-0009]